MVTQATYRVALLRADGSRVILGDELSHDEAGFLYWQAAGEHSGDDVQIEPIEESGPRVMFERETIGKRGLSALSLAAFLRGRLFPELLHNRLW